MTAITLDGVATATAVKSELASRIAALRSRVEALTAEFPLYPGLQQ